MTVLAMGLSPSPYHHFCCLTSSLAAVAGMVAAVVVAAAVLAQHDQVGFDLDSGHS